MPVRRHPVAVSKPDAPLNMLPLDVDLVVRLKKTYAQVRACDLQLAEVFYSRLFAAQPELRPMFRGDIAAQARKLTAALDAVVHNFERPVENAAMVAELGVRHAGYGVKPEHYETVIDILVESMRVVLGPSSDARSIDEWRMALQLIAKQMIAAAGQARAPR